MHTESHHHFTVHALFCHTLLPPLTPGRYKHMRAALCNLPSPRELGSVSTKVCVGLGV